MAAQTIFGELNFAVKKGQRNLGDTQAGRRVPQFTGETVNISADVAPLYLLTKKAGKAKAVQQATYFHLEKDILSTVVHDSGGGATSAAGSLSLLAGEGNRITINQALKVIRTGEIMLVTGFGLGADTPSVTRGFGGTPIGAVLANEEISIHTFVGTDGDTSPDGQSSEPFIKTNAVEIFRQSWELTGRDMNAENYGEEEVQRIKEENAEKIALQVERAFLFNNGVVTTGNQTMTGGCENYISTNVVNMAGGALGESFWRDNIVRPWFRRNQGAKNMYFFGGENIISGIESIYVDRLRFSPEDEAMGLKIARVRTTFGEVKMMTHGLLTPDADSTSVTNFGHSGWAFGLNMDLIGRRYFKNRRLTLLENRQTPDRDGKKWEFLADEGFWMASEQQQLLIKGCAGA